MHGIGRSSDSINPVRRIVRIDAETAAAMNRRVNRVQTCPCNGCIDLFWNLRQSQVWPVSHAYKENTAASLITKLGGLTTTIPSQTRRKACDTCVDDFAVVVREHFQHARSIFPGLCLDCVKYRSKDRNEPYACRSKHRGFQGICGSVL